MGGVLANDQLPSGLPVEVVLVTPPQHGTVELAPDGNFVYTPDPNYDGPDSFQYELKGVPIVASVLANDQNPNDDQLEAAVVTQPQHGQLQFQIDGHFRYEPAPDFVGEDGFTYVVRGTKYKITSAACQVTIRVVQAPVGVPDSYVMMKGTVLDTRAASNA